MPHTRKRYLSAALIHALKHSPIVGVLGQRQTGKTTLTQQLVSTHYVTLDDPEQLAFAQNRPKSFLERSHTPYGIDECQLAPELFPALKLTVQNKKKMGQFLVTGSVRFNARKEIRESLTGRIQLLELQPLTVSEARGLPLPDLFKAVGSGFSAFSRHAQTRMGLFQNRELLHYLEVGGLPGICFFRDIKARSGRWNAHLDTLLGRDLRLVSQTNLSVLVMRRVLSALSRSQGLPISFSVLSRETRVSKPALIKLIDAFEALFLIRRVLPMGDAVKESYFFEDQGIATYLLTQSTPVQDTLRLCFSQIFAHLNACAHATVEVFSYETRNGAQVPLVFKSSKQLLGIIPILSETPDQKSLRSAQSFLRRHPSAHCLILTQGTEVSRYSDALWISPARACF